jgi:hypothetical protein
VIGLAATADGLAVGDRFKLHDLVVDFFEDLRAI